MYNMQVARGILGPECGSEAVKGQRGDAVISISPVLNRDPDILIIAGIGAFVPPKYPGYCRSRRYYISALGLKFRFIAHVLFRLRAHSLRIKKAV